MQTFDSERTVIERRDVVRIGRHLVRVEDVDGEKQRVMVRGKWVASRATVLARTAAYQDRLDAIQEAKTARQVEKIVRRIVRLIEALPYHV